MRRTPFAQLSAVTVLVAHLAMLFLAAPCLCLDGADSSSASAAVCCCGPDAAQPCHGPGGEDGRSSCDQLLGDGCLTAPADPTAVAAAGTLDGELAPRFVTTLALTLPAPRAPASLLPRVRTPSPPSSRLEQVRSIVLRT